jgi:hypothetical protein
LQNYFHTVTNSEMAGGSLTYYLEFALDLAKGRRKLAL